MIYHAAISVRVVLVSAIESGAALLGETRNSAPLRLRRDQKTQEPPFYLEPAR